jgi:hypothetical protein
LADCIDQHRASRLNGPLSSAIADLHAAEHGAGPGLGLRALGRLSVLLETVRDRRIE